jgi:O-acetyl-ADP-ribose deacetylase (regulator of RNase III)
LTCGVDNDCKTIAFPAISCGAYGFPIAEACDVAMQEVCKFLDETDAISTVYFACFSPEIEKELRRAKEDREILS